jgi:hypothetical protein
MILPFGPVATKMSWNPEVTGDLVAPLVFKTSVGLDKVPGGFDSHSPPLPSGWAVAMTAEDHLPHPYSVPSASKLTVPLARPLARSIAAPRSAQTAPLL